MGGGGKMDTGTAGVLGEGILGKLTTFGRWIEEAYKKKQKKKVTPI